ncbi:MAG TPA: amino acid deaminase/aldolase [Pseudonocardiaceae bacterium]
MNTEPVEIDLGPAARPSPATVATAGALRYEELEHATAHLEPPFAVVDLDAFDVNAADLVRRSGTKPIRLASKSVRARDLLQRALDQPGFQGILAFTLAEALWLAEAHEDVVIGYPTADVEALRRLAGDERLAARVTLMIDSTEHLDFVEAALGPKHPPIRICIDLDAALELAGGRVHLGPLRSPVHSPRQATQLARAVIARSGFELVGLMAYEGQIAGLGDNQPGQLLKRGALRAMQRMSAEDLKHRRADIVAAVRGVAPLEFVNGGGTGSLELTSAEAAVTEVTAGSGLYAPGLFDHYRAFRPQPAAFFVLSVVRRPGPRIATVLGGGWVASGPPGGDRLPTIAWPRALRYASTEAAGEVQTPVVGAGAVALGIGDRVWFRHAKAGELCERVDELHLVQGRRVVATVPTYRGEGKDFL